MYGIISFQSLKTFSNSSPSKSRSHIHVTCKSYVTACLAEIHVTNSVCTDSQLSAKCAL